MEALAVLLPLWLAALVTPGPDTLAVSRATLSGGRRAGLACAAGVAAGIAVWTAAALLGLALVVTQVAWLHRLVALLGAAWLVVAGIGMLRASLRRGGPVAAAERPRAPHVAAPGLARPFRLGLLTNLANPKAAVLFGSMFALALPPRPEPVEALVVVAAFAGTCLAWYALLAALLARPAALAAYRRAGRALDAAAGTAFVALGLRLAWTETR